MDQEIMKQLLANKDKHKASARSRESFENEWISYAEENGVNETAIEYLYIGYEYRKFHPFINYLKKQNARMEPVKAFLGSKEYSINRSKSFKMTLNLLGILIAELPDEYEIMAIVIKWLPDVSLGKDKKRNPEIGKIFAKHFISELKPDTALPPLESLMLRPAMMEKFVSLMNDGLSAFCASDGIRAEEQIIADNIKAWLKDSSASEAEKAQIETTESEEKETPTAADNNALCKNDGEKETVSESGSQGNETPKPGLVPWRFCIQSLSKHIEGLENKVKQMQVKMDALEEARQQAEKETDILKKQMEEKSNDLAKLNNKCGELSYEVLKKGREIEDLKGTLAAKEAEIADRIKLADIVSRDRSRQSDAVLQRLSGELASYYEDFKNAEDFEKTSEMEEVLWDQLKDVYTILKKNGISL